MSHRSKVFTWILLGVSCTLLVAGVVSLLREQMLTRTAQLEAQVAVEGDEVDWDVLREKNKDTVAWLRVEGTSIDTPIVQSANNSYYLRHTFLGDNTLSGTPFLDWRADPNEGVQLVYGHHFTGTSLAFSDLQRACDQDVFDGLGNATWITPEEGKTILVPLCSYRTRASDQDAQTVNLTHGSTFMHEWLKTQIARSSAHTKNAEKKAAYATRVLTLVTCWSDIPRQLWRCVTIFCEVPDVG